jgi:predicted dienelactone hydrolase
MSNVPRPLRASLLLAALACVWSLHAAAAPQDAAPIVTVNPVVLKDAAQGKEILLRVTAPVKGRNLPILLFSHGAQYSKDDYLPLTEFWASHGYVVIQPTHIESLALGLPRNDPRIQDAWKTRVLDLRKALDSLAEIEKQAPVLKGRMDRKRVLAAGHSFGGHTTAVLIGAKTPEMPEKDLSDPRVMAGVMLAPPGLAPGFRQIAWQADARPALNIVGMDDIIPGFNDDWQAHAQYYYERKGGPQCLAAMTGMKHYLGGTLGTNRTEEKTPSADSMAQIKRLSLAFLDYHARGSKDWETVRSELLASRPPVIGVFECR